MLRFRDVSARCVVALALFSVVAVGCQVSISTGKGPPPIHGDPEFGAVILATDVDPVSMEPRDNVQEFGSDAKEMHAAVKVKNLRGGGEFRFQWKKGGRDTAEIIMNVPVDIYDNWVSAYLKPTDGIPVGDDWQVDVLYKGELISTARFKVTDASPQPST